MEGWPRLSITTNRALSLEGWPRLEVVVRGKDADGRNQLAGYGQILVPTTLMTYIDVFSFIMMCSIVHGF